MSKISRQRMEAIIRGGGSVMFEGKIITDVGQLPTEAQLAIGDTNREQAVVAQLLLQKAELERQLAQLQGNQQAPVNEAPANTEGGENKPAPSAPAETKPEAKPDAKPEAKPTTSTAKTEQTRK
jgi:hypothetical protein